MSAVLKFETLMQEMNCGKCGVSFAVPQSFYTERYNNGGTWYCPNGDPRIFTKSEVQRLKEKLEAEQKARAKIQGQLWDSENQRQQLEKKQAKLKKRIAAGVCPCCNRQFQNLARHMHSKHKNYVAPAEGGAAE